MSPPRRPQMLPDGVGAAREQLGVWNVPQPPAIWAAAEHSPALSSICADNDKELKTQGQFSSRSLLGLAMGTRG